MESVIFERLLSGASVGLAAALLFGALMWVVKVWRSEHSDNRADGKEREAALSATIATEHAERLADNREREDRYAELVDSQVAALRDVSTAIGDLNAAMTASYERMEKGLEYREVLNKILSEGKANE